MTIDAEKTYITMRQMLLNNGHRHRANGITYLSHGNLEYAIGSFRKMLRNYEMADQLSDYKSAGLNDLVDRLAQSVANQILSGN